MPFIDFTAGDVLTATNVDIMFRQGIMSFADAAARDTALTGVLAEGLFAYLADADIVTRYNGSLWVRYSGSIDDAGAGAAVGVLNTTYASVVVPAGTWSFIGKAEWDVSLSVSGRDYTAELFNAAGVMDTTRWANPTNIARGAVALLARDTFTAASTTVVLRARASATGSGTQLVAAPKLVAIPG